MVVLLALGATILTSWLPICTKILVRATRPEVVAWSINAASLPILAAGTLLLTHGSPPRVDAMFVGALLASALFNWIATILATKALAQADASLVSPLLTFNPVFTLAIAWPVLGEQPDPRGTLGVVIILLGAYLLALPPGVAAVAAPMGALLRQPGTLLAVLASAVWGATIILEKIAIEHVTPPSGPLVALASTLITVLLLTPAALAARYRGNGGRVTDHPYALGSAILIAGIAPLLGFSAIALGFVGYVTALFKLSAILTLIWARLVLREGQMRQRALGTVVMLIGGILVAA